MSYTRVFCWKIHLKNSCETISKVQVPYLTYTLLMTSMVSRLTLILNIKLKGKKLLKSWVFFNLFDHHQSDESLEVGRKGLCGLWTNSGESRGVLRKRLEIFKALWKYMHWLLIIMNVFITWEKHRTSTSCLCNDGMSKENLHFENFCCSVL